jgi:hypothetical protein
LLVDALAEAGVKQIYGVSGDSLNGITASQHDGPALVEAIVSRQELSMPPTITLEQMKGFTLTPKVVLSGRGDEIVDLAKTNFFR